MAEKNPKSNPEKAETKEKPEGDDTGTAILTPEDNTEGFEETGYGSAPGSSDVMSGAESSIWASDDHAPKESKSRDEILEAISDGLSTNPAGVIKKPTSKKPKSGFFKKASPVGKHVESTARLTENLMKPEEEEKTKFSPRRTRSKTRFTSGLPNLVSLTKTKTADKSRSYSPGKKKGSKTSPKKASFKKQSSGILTLATPKKERLIVTLDDKEHAPSTEKKTSVKNLRSSKSISSPSKAKSSVHAASVRSKSCEVPSQAADSLKTGECAVKPKRTRRFSLDKFKTTKKVATAETSRTKRSSSTEVKTGATSATSSAYAMVKKGIKKMDVTGKLKRRNSTEKHEKIHLLDKAAKAKQGEDESSEDQSPNDPYVFRETSWRPKYSAQKGGHLAEDMIAYLSSSPEKATTPTEMTTLSDSFSLNRGKSKSRRTLDSHSNFSIFEEEVGATGGLEGVVRPQLQRQTNVPDLEMDEDSGDDFDCPKSELMPKKESEDEMKE